MLISRCACTFNLKLIPSADILKLIYRCNCQTVLDRYKCYYDKAGYGIVYMMVVMTKIAGT